jgi:hypothetical protein
MDVGQISVKLVVPKFVGYPQEHQNPSSQTDGQTGDVERGRQAVFAEATEREQEVVADHGFNS